MSPTVFKYKNYRFMFFSREEKKVHIHVHSPDGEAKFWIEPRVVLIKNYGFTNKQIKEIQKVIEVNKNDIKKAWNKHFSS
jgi:hypothetical protein